MIPAGETIASQNGREPIWVGEIPEAKMRIGSILFDPVSGIVLRCDSVTPEVWCDARISSVNKVFEGSGPPSFIPDATVDDYYLDLDTGNLYRLVEV